MAQCPPGAGLPSPLPLSPTSQRVFAQCCGTGGAFRWVPWGRGLVCSFFPLGYAGGCSRSGVVPPGSTGAVQPEASQPLLSHPAGPVRAQTQHTPAGRCQTTRKEAAAIAGPGIIKQGRIIGSFSPAWPGLGAEEATSLRAAHPPATSQDGARAPHLPEPGGSWDPIPKPPSTSYPSPDPTAPSRFSPRAPSLPPREARVAMGAAPLAAAGGRRKGTALLRLTAKCCLSLQHSQGK